MISSARTTPEISRVPPGQEQAFNTWLKRNNVRDLDAPDAFYDYRGAFLAGVNRGPNGHWPDTFKQHGHPTFSVESQYAIPNDPQAGHWSGERYIPPMNSIPSATTQPAVQARVRDRAYWTSVIHNVAKVAPNDPRYPVSRQVRDQAIQGLQDLADTATERDIKDISPGKVGTALVNFGHGASIGLAGNPTARTAMTNAFISSGNPVLAALSFGLNDPENYQQYIAASREANPKTAYISDALGTAATATLAAPAVAGAGPAIGGGILGGTMGATRGAADPTIFPGMTRAEAAAVMGVGGAVTGAMVGKLVSGLTPALKAIKANFLRFFGRSATPQDIASATESAIRAELTRLKVKPDVIEQAVSNWKTNGTLSTAAPPAEPIAVRPGETITRTSPQGFEVTGTRATPPVPTTPTIAEMQGFRTEPLGKGQTLPWYPRGGQAEQAVAPLPAQAPGSAPPNQSAVLIDYLKQATSPQDAITRLGTLRNLGIPVPQDPNQILQLLFGAQR